MIGWPQLIGSIDAMTELEVVGIQLEASSGAPIVILQETGGSRCLPIWVGPAEAMAIAVGMDDVPPARPQTHDLLAAVLQELTVSEISAEIISVEDGIFRARLIVGDEEFDARASDVVALAVRMDLPLHCPAEVIAEAGVEVAPPVEDEVSEFKKFLDSISAEDFED